jgi:hypothetical protein
LASRADKPYAKPGDTVKVDVLAYDGRPDKSRPMQLYWIPAVCTNPPNDLYYLCPAQMLSDLCKKHPEVCKSGGAGGGAAGAPRLPTGIDLTPYLVTGPSFSFGIPADVVSSHPIVQGAPAPYGLVIAFNVACAGHVEFTATSPDDLRKQQIPLGCFDENHVQLGPSEYVIGFTRIYAYDTLTNQNPPITNATFQGNPVDPSGGVTVDHCDARHRADCPEQKIGVTVPDEAWEPNPGDSSNGGNAHEEIWADYYVTIGDWKYDARLLFDTKAGRLVDVDNSLYAPDTPGEGAVFIVVHDNRNGANWTSFPLHVK